MTQWAFVGRLLGWLVLLGYLSAGYLLVAYGGNTGVRQLMGILSKVAIAIVMWKAIQKFALPLNGSGTVFSSTSYEGYAANRNAFAFQLLLVMSIVMAYTPVFGKASRDSLLVNISCYEIVVLGILMTGVMWTGSRAGILSCLGLVFVGILCGTLKMKIAVRSLSVAFGIWLVFYAGTFFTGAGSEIQTNLSGDASNLERWRTWKLAIQLWIENPFFGAGLGVFFAKSKEWFNSVIVVHSTPLWLLAEFGIMGMVFTIFASVQLIKYLGSPLGRHQCPHKAGLLFLLLVFGIFGLFHDIFYQRMVWFILGALMASPASAMKLTDK